MFIKCCIGAVLLISLTTLSAFCQDDPGSPFFVKVSGGYGFLGPGSYTLNNGTTNGYFKQSDKRFGIGLRLGVGLGYIINEYLNVGIDAVYQKGSNLSISSAYHQTDETGIFNNNIRYYSTKDYTNRVSYDYSLLNIIPHITFKAISKPDYYIYNRVGFIIGKPLVFSKTTYDSGYVQQTSLNLAEQQDYKSNYVINQKGEYSKSPYIGFQAAVGIMFRLSEKLRFLSEVEASSLVLNPDKLDNSNYEGIISTQRLKPAPQATIESHKDLLPRHVYFEKQGQTRTVVTDKEVNIYQGRDRFTTNSISINIGFAYRL